jgi:hypothetical protein
MIDDESAELRGLLATLAVSRAPEPSAGLGASVVRRATRVRRRRRVVAVLVTACVVAVVVLAGRSLGLTASRLTPAEPTITVPSPTPTPVVTSTPTQSGAAVRPAATTSHHPTASARSSTRTASASASPAAPKHSARPPVTTPAVAQVQANPFVVDCGTGCHQVQTQVTAEDRTGILLSIIVSWGDGARNELVSSPPTPPGSLMCTGGNAADTPSHSYYAAGTYTITVVVRYEDCDGQHPGTTSTKVNVSVR